MNVEFKEMFGADIQLIPLRDTGNVVCANATRIDWDTVCPASGDEIYLFSNPPYLGSRLQNAQQKADLQGLQGLRADIQRTSITSAAVVLARGAVCDRHQATLGFVSTNSICQGDQVGLLWPHIYVPALTSLSASMHSSGQTAPGATLASPV